jgi:signal transduction histidine kinase/ligand-binding sensor domain-containing protein/AraC-like DNA-binding protein
MSGEIIEYIQKKVSHFFLVISLILSISGISFSQSHSRLPEPVFEAISTGTGLPNTTITCILQDYSGFLWLGTENGLVKYDGYSMQVFQPDKSDTGSISSRGIVKIYEDKSKTLWIATLNGLNKFNRADETFVHYKNIPDNPNSINSDSVQCIFEDDSGRFWIGTDKGLNLFDRERGSFNRYDFTLGDSTESYSLIENRSRRGVNAITDDNRGDDLLLGTDKDGLWKFDISLKRFSKYKIESVSNPDQKIGWIQSFYKSRSGKLWMISDNSVTSLDLLRGKFKSYIEFPKMDNRNVYESRSYAYGNIIEDREGLIWFGFVNLEKGIFYLNEKTGLISLYQLYKSQSQASFSNRIFALYTDNSGIVWAGTLDRGLWKYDRRKNNFQVLRHEAGNPNSLSSSNVYDIVYDKKGNIWIMTTGGLDKYNVKKNKYTHYLNNKEQITPTRRRILLDKTGEIWIAGTMGLEKFNPVTGSLIHYADNSVAAPDLAGKSIFRLIQDHLGYLWIATIHSGLYKYDIPQNKLTLYVNDPKDPGSIHDDKIRTLYEDRDGTMWVGTNYGGLNRFDRGTETFTNYGFYSPTAVHEDKYGNFWVADYFTGLSLLDRSENKVTENYTKKDGLPHSEITQILEDDSGNLWLGTIDGLSKFNIEARTFKNYYTTDGLPDNNFLSSKAAVDADGRMYFGITGGVVAFHPDKVKDDSIPPQVVLSRVSLINKPEEKLNYNGPVSERGELTIPYDHNDLRFDFVGLHFSEPQKIRYRYMLVNYDENWIDAGTQRNASYTNLEPGKYIFRVTAANRDGVWNKKGVSLTILINSPWWATIYAYIFYLIVVSGIVYLVWRMQLKRVKIRHDYEMRNLEAEKLQELDEMKTHFFTNISHEFRTPLTLIQGPAKQILELSTDNRVSEKARLIHRSAKKLNRLANQLLDISRIESGKMKLKVYEQDLIPVIRELVASFHPFAEKKQISLKFVSEYQKMLLFFDRDKVDKILNNLLSNALKFTPQGGSVKLSLGIKSEGNEKDFIWVSVIDNGIGIPREQLSKIFDRFYQVDNRLSKEYEGTGIGLSLTKELVELHKGKISIESREGQGSVFTVFLPAGSENFLPEEFDHNIGDQSDKTKTEPEIDEPVVLQSVTNPSVKNGYHNEKDKPVLLIIEDNVDVRQYIKEILSGSYTVLEAPNGEEGLSISFCEIPDLIISDIMMPGLDGIQVSQKLKSDSRTSHIPLILLTAKTSLSDKLEGLETGADDYIMKPFEASELKARIKNLLEQRKRLHEHFKKFGLLEIEEKKLLSIDQKFLQKAVDIINENIADPDFNVESFTKKMAVSRSLLYKKLVSLTGDSPVELIKRIRLNKAASLVENNSGNITEISFAVGFSNPSYFTECFKNQFGIPPTLYHKNTAPK